MKETTNIFYYRNRKTRKKGSYKMRGKSRGLFRILRGSRLRVVGAAFKH